MVESESLFRVRISVFARSHFYLSRLSARLRARARQTGFVSLESQAACPCFLAPVGIFFAAKSVMGMEKERERYVYVAKLSEQAERYDG